MLHGHAGNQQSCLQASDLDGCTMGAAVVDNKLALANEVETVRILLRSATNAELQFLLAADGDYLRRSQHLPPQLWP